MLKSIKFIGKADSVGVILGIAPSHGSNQDAAVAALATLTTKKDKGDMLVAVAVRIGRHAELRCAACQTHRRFCASRSEKLHRLAHRFIAATHDRSSRA